MDNPTMGHWGLVTVAENREAVNFESVERFGLGIHGGSIIYFNSGERLQVKETLPQLFEIYDSPVQQLTQLKNGLIARVA